VDLVTHALSGAALGAACAPSPREQLPLMIVGAVAGMAPDLDALSGLRGPAAAWRNHRVWLHGLPTLPVQALVIYLLAQGLSTTPLNSPLLWLTIIGGLLVHLLLDTVTSFGTVLGFPFNRTRWSTHSHFIVDPGVLILLVVSLAADVPAIGLGLSGAWLLAGIAVRHHVVRTLREAIQRTGEPLLDLQVEPGPLAPFCWLAVVRQAAGHYSIARVSWSAKVLTPWQTIQSHEDPQIQTRARNLPVVRAFLDTVDCPFWTVLETTPAGTTVLLEDLKWRIFPPFRPLVFRIHLGTHPTQDRAVQMPLGWRGPNQSPHRPPAPWEVVVVTTAAPPWYTGTALNALHRAKTLASQGKTVCLLFPWLQPRCQTAVFPGGQCFDSPDAHAQWLRDTFATGLVHIRFYPARWSPRWRTIFPTDAVARHIPETDLLILEEPEHLAWLQPWTQIKRRVQARTVLGIIHTHYADYLRTGTAWGRWGGKYALALSGAYLRWLARRQCDQIIRLSAAVNGESDSPVVVVNGVDDHYFAPRGQSTTAGLYFIGKLIWEKGWREMIELLAHTPGQTLHVYGAGPQQTVQDIQALAEVLCTTTAEALAMGKFVLVPKHPSNAFFSLHPNCLEYESSEEFQRLLAYAQTQPPARVNAMPSLSWDAATQRLLRTLQRSERPCTGDL